MALITTKHQTALIATDCDAMRSLSTECGPNHLGILWVAQFGPLIVTFKVTPKYRPPSLPNIDHHHSQI